MNLFFNKCDHFYDVLLISCNLF